MRAVGRGVLGGNDVTRHLCVGYRPSVVSGVEQQPPPHFNFVMQCAPSPSFLGGSSSKKSQKETKPDTQTGDDQIQKTSDAALFMEEVSERNALVKVIDRIISQLLGLRSGDLVAPRERFDRGFFTHRRHEVGPEAKTPSGLWTSSRPFWPRRPAALPARVRREDWRQRPTCVAAAAHGGSEDLAGDAAV